VISAAGGRVVTAWTSLVVNTSLFAPAGAGSGSATVSVLDAASGAVLTSAALNTGGDTTVGLAGISAPSHPALRVRLDLASAGGQATPRVNSFKVLYSTQAAPIVLTLGVSATRIVFGQRVTLSGTLAQGSSGLAGQSVGLSAQGAGDASFMPLPPATTDSAGAFTSSVAPSKNTTYKASFSGAPEPTVSVTVAYRVTLRVVRKGGKYLFRGKVGPKRRGRVVIQVKTRSGWKRLARVRLTKKSAFRLLRKLPAHKKLRLRATVSADAKHLAGRSRVVTVKTR
jgi:hypothetical protein